MFVAIRYMQGEINAIADLIGPFDDYEESNAWIRQHWADYDPRDCDRMSCHPRHPGDDPRGSRLPSPANQEGV